MSDEKAPAVNAGDLALRAAVADRVMTLVKGICQPVIDANAAHIRSTAGLRSTTAQLPDEDGTVPLATFSRRMRRESFFVEDRAAWLNYAEQRGETEVTVKPAFETAVLGRGRWDRGTRSVIDSKTGEILPGIGRTAGGETVGVGVSWTDDGRTLIDEHLGFLGPMLADLPALTAASFAETPEATQ
ncbi:hypothetical protein ACFVHW_04460 [Streptomyces sp. NPDC127110]|uniref:hypothetical protein n=1 Tax=Streptomyces sp. NPDC127110 TaxID=3345362 RepID=UPI003625BBB7